MEVVRLRREDGQPDFGPDVTGESDWKRCGQYSDRHCISVGNHETLLYGPRFHWKLRHYDIITVSEFKRRLGIPDYKDKALFRETRGGKR